MVAGPLEVVYQAVWSHMRTKGIWGANEELEASEEAEVEAGCYHPSINTSGLGIGRYLG
jgi:hypothetical protein